ncbi:hypothetical protein AHAS_Ahas19G0228500 [Arachis hypogaea]
MDFTFNNKIVGLQFVHQIWQKIDDYFNKSADYNLKQLQSQLKLFKKYKRLATDYIFKIKSVANSLAALGNPHTSQQHIEALLEGLNSKYQMFLFTVNFKLKLYSLLEFETLILSHDDMIEKFRTPDNLLL